MDIQEMMRQAQAMQVKMQEMQEKLSDMEVEAASGGGAVSVVMTCKGDIRNISISPDIINPQDKETLEDLVMAAVNLARAKADETMADETRRMMEDLGIPANAGMPGM